MAQRISQSGYDITPLTAEKKSELAALLTDHQRCSQCFQAANFATASAGCTGSSALKPHDLPEVFVFHAGELLSDQALKEHSQGKLSMATLTTTKKLAFTLQPLAACHCFLQRQSLTLAQAGPPSMPQLTPHMSSRYAGTLMLPLIALIFCFAALFCDSVVCICSLCTHDHGFLCRSKTRAFHSCPE